MDHQRIVPRRRILKAGSIESGGEPIDCNVRNLSETGAALDVLSPLYIPDRFTLVVWTDQLKRPATSSGAKKNASASRSIEVTIPELRRQQPDRQILFGAGERAGSAGAFCFESAMTVQSARGALLRRRRYRKHRR
jgi:hypothetical protein